MVTQKAPKAKNVAATVFFLGLAIAAATFAIVVGLDGTVVLPADQLPSTLRDNHIGFAAFAGIFALACLAESILGAGRRHRAVLRLEPAPAGYTIVYGILGLVAVTVATAALIYPNGPWWELWKRPVLDKQQLAIAALVAGSCAVLFLTVSVVSGRRWRRSRVVERISKDPRYAALTPETTWTPRTTRRVSAPMTLEVNPLKPKKFGPKPRQLRTVTGQHNVIGKPPMNIAYLRLFENQVRTRTFVKGAWREFGYVHMLRSAASVSPREYRRIKKSRDYSSIFVSSPPALERTLQRSDYRAWGKGFHLVTNVANRKVRVWDRHGSYPVQGVLCHGEFWKQAVDQLLLRADLVVMDLSGFWSENKGIQYELQRVIDRFPIERIVFIADPLSNRRFLREHLQLAWSRMDAGSPNAAQQRAQTTIAVTDRYVQPTSQNANGSSSAGQPYLAAQRSQTRRILASVQRQVLERPRQPQLGRVGYGFARTHVG